MLALFHPPGPVPGPSGPAKTDWRDAAIAAARQRHGRQFKAGPGDTGEVLTIDDVRLMQKDAKPRSDMLAKRSFGRRP